MSSCDSSPHKTTQMQGRKRAINDAEEQPTARGLVENIKKQWTKKFMNAQENPSSNEEYVHEHPGLCRLKPPSRSDGFSTKKEHLNVLKAGSEALISRIKKSADANQMINFSAGSFTYFDSLGVDYTPLYQVVCSAIRHCCEKEALAKQKPHPSFATIAAHDQAALELSKAEERCTRVKRKLEDARRERDEARDHHKHLYEELRKEKEEKAKCQAKAAALQAYKVTCGEACSKAKSELEKIALKMNQAQKAIDDFERRQKETIDGFNGAMAELSSIVSSLQ